MGDFMKRRKLNAVYETDMKEFLESVGILKDIEDKKIRCRFCGELITIENIAAIFPEHNEIFVCCRRIDCSENLKDRFK